MLVRFLSVLQPEGDDGGTTTGLELYCSMREMAAAAAHPHGHTLSVPKDPRALVVMRRARGFLLPVAYLVC